MALKTELRSAGPAATPLAADAAGHLAFAVAALNLAGHEVTDPALQALMEGVARGELNGAEAVAAMRRHVQG